MSGESSHDSPWIVEFPEGYDHRAEVEAETAKGWLGGVIVVAPGGSRYEIIFMDPERVRQSLEAEAGEGRPVLAEAGLLVVKSVSRLGMLAAVQAAWDMGYFDRLRPIAPSP